MSHGYCVVAITVSRTVPMLEIVETEGLNVYLETARGHPTGRLWVDCFVKPTLLSLMFLPGEGNGDFLLQQQCLKAMLPYFFAAGHHNYARYLNLYVRQMEQLPHRTKEDLLAGAHVCRHSDWGPQCQQISSESRHISSEGRVLEV